MNETSKKVCDAITLLRVKCVIAGCIKETVEPVKMGTRY